MTTSNNLDLEDLTQLKVAVVHDILDQYGGGERVLEHILKIFPQADLFVSRDIGQKRQTDSFIRQHKIKTSFLQRFPQNRFFMKFTTPLLPWAFESFDLDEYDLVISSTAHFAKAVLTKPHQLHICYCHTTPRFLYHYPTESPTRNSLLYKPFVKLLDHKLRQYDYVAAQRPDYFVVNSQTTQKRVKKFYKRQAIVIYPPVQVDKFRPPDLPEKEDYFLIVSRLVSYKNISTAVRAFQQRAEPLVIVGIGPELKQLQSLASNSPQIEFKGFVSNSELVKLYQRARALIFTPKDEDFGITAVEAMAAGTPVIAYQGGGVTETVLDNQTGVFYKEDSAESLNKAIDKFVQKEDNFQHNKLLSQAEQFSANKFEKRFRDFVLAEALKSDHE